MITVVIPARAAASSFSFRPPIGRTLPRNVSSPVIATSWRTGMPEINETSAQAMVTPDHPPRDPPRQVRDQLLQAAQPRLARVLADDPAGDLAADDDLVRGEPGLGHLLGNDVALGDGQLLFFRVSRQVQRLHAVAQRG